MRLRVCDGADGPEGDGRQVGPSVLSGLPGRRELERRVQALFAGWRLEPARTVAVYWNPRLRTTAGRAFPASARIELNPNLLARARDHVDEVLAHEAAHLAVHWLHGRSCRPHGDEWQRLMVAAGQPARVRHRLPVPRTRRRRFHYLHLCQDCGHRHLAGKVIRAVCRSCGPGASLLVLRAPRSAAGRRALEAMTLSEARRRCIMAAP